MARLLKRRNPRHELAGLSPLMSRLYAGRGITDPGQVDHQLAHLLRPSALKGLQQASTLLADAVSTGLKILIVGDFDADGATSCALMVHVLRAYGAADVDYLVPNRFEYGYGLTPEIVDVAEVNHPDLIVTVDNGISSLEGVARARVLGIKTIITDHHLPASTLPEADAIVNPNQPDCQFPSKNLAGVGVAFYLLSGVRAVLSEQGWFETRPSPNLATYLDLVALGTIADVVPLDFNNRILVQEGVKRIRAGHCRPGILALIAASGNLPVSISAQGLAFGVAPRLNAAGRLEDMSLGIECLLTDDPDRARELASKLNELNQSRKDIELDMKTQALEKLKQINTDALSGLVGICLFDESWHQGVVGIVASRVKDKVNRPVIAFARASDNELKGSARSISGFHIRDALDAVAARNPGLLNKFGGHAMAAGLSLAPEHFKTFSEEFNREAKHWLTADDLEQVVITDGEIEAPTLSMVREITMACPWGQGFAEPLFDSMVEIIEQRLLGGKHLKLKVRLHSGNQVFDAIAFNEDRLVEGRNRRIAFRVDVNEYRGQETVQFIVECLDLKSSVD